MFNNNGIVIKGNKDGINATILMNEFESFEDMQSTLLKKLLKGKKFYKDTTFTLNFDFDLLGKSDIQVLKNSLINQIEIKDIVLKDIKDKGKDSKKNFSDVYEGKTKFIRKTVRGGQSINYNGNIVIIGDINNGAEVSASGNVIVLGRIRGKVSAGTQGNSKSVIVAFSLEPELLKIADKVALSPDEDAKPEYPELAKIEDGYIVVEPYLPNKYI
ncbi:septum site-determining protein MinC [Clostridium sp. BJN0001]|uniref:septum site-determining protein MinC n=1 Tax=Clostridium sp. BJN0001 TaxID=2930219 RepID=UPI001FD015C5|nr:septum site-determining protein MinC [Clostridium sp. BJN0001]